MYKYITLIMALFSYSLQAVSFDSPFHKTWYEKGLNATIRTYHMINNIPQKSHQQHLQSVIDEIIGSASFGLFCVKKMYHHKQQLIQDDIIYFVNLINNIRIKKSANLTKLMSTDYQQCFDEIINRIDLILKSPR